MKSDKRNDIAAASVIQRVSLKGTSPATRLRSVVSAAAVLMLCATMLAALAAAQPAGQPWSPNTSPLPPPTGFVNDYSGVIDANTKAALEKKLKDFRDSTDPSVELAVAVVDTTGDRDIFDYSLAVARGWKIGSKADDNPSALLFIAIKDRKYFTQVSRDLEDELPDGAVGSLQRQYLVPEFKKGNYSKGISDTLDAYINTIRNKGNTTGPTDAPVSGGIDSVGSGVCGLICVGAVLLFILILVLSRHSGGPSDKDKGRWGGGGFGGGSGGGLSSALPWIIGGIINSAASGGSSSGSDWGGSSGSSDWGGFGGGGDFGGGGSGGSW